MKVFFIRTFMILMLFAPAGAFPQINLDSLLQSSPLLKKIYLSKDKYRLQVQYTRIEKTSGSLSYQHASFNDQQYLYCASLIKLPIAVLALSKLNELGISEEAYLSTDSSEFCHHNVHRDTSAPDKYPTIAHYIKKMLLVSDNEAYNRCFEFLGTDYIHTKLAEWGYPEVRIVNRYEWPCSKNQYPATNPVRLFDRDFRLLYRQEAQQIETKWRKPLFTCSIGKAYIDQNNKLRNSPKDFSYMNFMRLKDAHRFLIDLLYTRADRFGLSTAQLQFLNHYMSCAPAGLDFPKYDAKTYPPHYKKYLYFGDNQGSVNDTTFVSTNIVGLSYGFISDCARFIGTDSEIEFVLSASLYVNANEIINDGIYEYKQLGLPFMTELGRKVIEFEKKSRGNRK